MFTAALFTTALDMEATLNVHDRGMDKENVVHTYDGILAIKENEMPFAATQMHLEIIILHEVNQTNIYDITYMWDLKK